MKTFVVLALLALLSCIAESRIVVKREVEREGMPRETVLVTDKDNGNDVETINGNGDVPEVIQFDLNNGGVLSFGGRVPSFDFDNFEQRMNDMIVSMMRRIKEMHRRMNETVSKYPNNYNKTDVEIVTIGGKQYRKETTVVNKRIHGMTIYSKSTVLVPVEDDKDGKDDKGGEDVDVVESVDGSRPVDKPGDRPVVSDKDNNKKSEIERESA